MDYKHTMDYKATMDYKPTGWLSIFSVDHTSTIYSDCSRNRLRYGTITVSYRVWILHNT